MSPHADPGDCTILLADPVPGLQVLGRDGRWDDVLPQPGTFLVHPGDRMPAWTGDRWRVPVHRVVPPPAGHEGPARRRSIAFVHAAPN
jgi:isopenicillin N synthase-like dioxygenase